MWCYYCYDDKDVDNNDDIDRRDDVDVDVDDQEEEEEVEQVRQIIVLVRISRDGNWELNREPFTPVMTGKRACLEHKYWKRHRHRQAQKVIGCWKLSFLHLPNQIYAVVQNTTNGIRRQEKRALYGVLFPIFEATFQMLYHPIEAHSPGRPPTHLLNQLTL